VIDEDSSVVYTTSGAGIATYGTAGGGLFRGELCCDEEVRMIGWEFNDGDCEDDWGLQIGSEYFRPVSRARFWELEGIDCHPGQKPA
jgi:hypothetical protein